MIKDIPKKRGIEIDIETSENIGTFYGPVYETRINRVLEHAHLTSFAVKHVDKKKIYVYDLEDFPLYKKDPTSDRALLQELTKWVEKSDYLVAHNGDGFDIPMVNARLDYWKLPELPPEKTVDTLKISRRLWKLPSYKLGDICAYFGIGNKLERGYGRQKRQMERRYVAHDVYLLDGLLELIRPHIPNHPAFKEIKQKIVSFDRSCPHCGSTHTQSRGERITNGKVHKQFQCRSENCYKWFPVIELPCKK